ncbi:MEDS domain-containing protein [Pyxidicoccus trucidator]|uniref:MEDS domain-containing protein n=1 Tax=Pyxidicoccus trucidator TaxID=2709662 RepID=UPI0013DA2D16|nr:MEDS domain-containing protein [Pyxidicoccus trucidator]
MRLPSTPPPPEGSAYHLGKELLRHPANDSHIVQFYEDEAFLLDVLDQYLGAGLAAGEPLIVIATEPHRRAILQRLAAAGVDVEAACGSGQLTLLDARETLSRFMVNGSPDEGRFQEVVGGALTRALAEGHGRRVRAYGEMVDLLWREGNPDAAVALEELWNDLAARYPFSLLCTYALGGFGDEAHARPFRDICRAHSHVVPTERYAGLEDPDCRLREVTLLQQRAQALENEVSHRRQVEQQLLEALSSRDDFLWGASHELRTPLTALRLQLQSLHRMSSSAGDEAPGERLHERLTKALGYVERLAIRVDGLLDVSRISGGQLRLEAEEVDLARLVREAVARSADTVERSECLVAVMAEGPVLGQWDRQRLEQVFLHLFDNALKYGRGRPVEVKVDGGPERARLVVKDHGIGIPAEHQDRIFRRFERAAPKDHFGGLGLGLWMTRRLVEAHGGSLQLQSEPGLGSTFIVELPYRSG